MPDALDQSTYQVRLDWGTAGLERLAPADVVVVVDVLGSGAAVLAAAEQGAGVQLADAGDVAVRAAAGPGRVVVAGLRNASAVADWILAVQHERGARTSIAIVPSGATDAAGHRPAVEDLLGAGAVVAALGDRGVDHTSPDAAVAAEGFRALRRAVRHLLTASGTGLQLAAEGRADEVLAAAAVDAASVVPVLRAGAFPSA